jgi:hypothetical protein
VSRPDPASSARSRDRAIASLLASALASNTAYAAIGTVLGLQVYTISHRELDLGLLGMAQFAPAFLLVLVTGNVADRVDRALICSIGQLGQAAVAGLLLLATQLGVDSVLPIFAIVVVFGTARAFVSAAQGPLPADIVTADRLPWLTARRSLASRPGLIIGPVLGGALFAVDNRLPYVAIGGLYLLAAALLWLIHLERRHIQRPARPAGPPMTAGAYLRESLEGLRVIGRTPLLLGAISLDLFAVLFGGAVALLPALAEERLGADAVGLGVLRGAAGVGSGLVLLALAVRPVERRVGRVLLVSIGIFGAATLVLGATTEFVVAVVAMAVLSGADSISVFIRSNLVPLGSPRGARGRVAAVESLFVGASNELGAFESGATGQLFGAPAAVVLGGAATLAVVGAYATFVPALLSLDRYPVPDDEPAGDDEPARGAVLPDLQ